MFLFGKKRKQKLSKVLSLHGMAIRYVTERINDNDDIVGRGGSISIRDGEVIVFASSDVIFRSRVEETEVSDLMSGDGVVISAKDIAHGNRERTIIAYYVYYRK